MSIVTSRSDYDDEVDDTADISATDGLNIGILLYNMARMVRAHLHQTMRSGTYVGKGKSTSK